MEYNNEKEIEKELNGKNLLNDLPKDMILNEIINNNLQVNDVVNLNQCSKNLNVLTSNSSIFKSRKNFEKKLKQAISSSEASLKLFKDQENVLLFLPKDIVILARKHEDVADYFFKNKNEDKFKIQWEKLTDDERESIQTISENFKASRRQSKVFL